MLFEKVEHSSSIFTPSDPLNPGHTLKVDLFICSRASRYQYLLSPCRIWAQIVRQFVFLPALAYYLRFLFCWILRTSCLSGQIFQRNGAVLALLVEWTFEVTCHTIANLFSYLLVGHPQRMTQIFHTLLDGKCPATLLQLGRGRNIGCAWHTGGVHHELRAAAIVFAFFGAYVSFMFSGGQPWR